MAGVTKLPIGTQKTETEKQVNVVVSTTSSTSLVPASSSATLTSTLTSESMQEILHTENQPLLDTQNEMVQELKNIKLGMQLITEEELAVGE